MNVQPHPLVFAILMTVLPVAIPRAGAAEATDQCPRFQFNPPDPYKGGMKYSFITPGSTDAKTGAFGSVCSGFWRQPNPQESSTRAKRSWSITVSKRDDPKLVEAYNAKDGYAADLARADSGKTTPYLYARFQKFSFPWGNAVGYFVQTTRDATWPEPNNAQLTYEIRGVTSDRQYIVVARFAVGHPQLPAAGSNVLDARGDIRTLTSFESYKLLEKSRPETFEPSLAEIQDLVSSVVVLGPKKSQKVENEAAKPEPNG
ncbi:MAG TPA: hypothetical protein VHS80_07315 [Chthoniobacterales bacterium]|nr:hypothetical protein [Chthoniobacterales bacterium]